MPHHTQETSPVLKHAGLDAVAAPANPRAHRVSVLVVQGGNNRGRTQIRAGADVCQKTSYDDLFAVCGDVYIECS